MITGKVELEMKNLVVAFVAAAAGCSAFGVEISPILEGKLAAFSFTYDDGAYSHYTTALPMHLKYGLPATFLIITDRVERDRAFARGARVAHGTEGPHLRLCWERVPRLDGTHHRRGGMYTRGNIRIATGRGDSAESYRKQLDEKVSVNGKDAAPNASGAVLAHTGDTIAVR